MIKFEPRYRAEIILPNGNTIEIKYPLTCHFNASVGIMSESISASFDFYNLAPSTREYIFQDLFTLDISTWKYIYFYAGYTNGDKDANLPLCFKGRIKQAYSAKNGGSTDVVTHIEAQALDVLGFTTSHTFSAGTSFKDAYKTMASDLPNVAIGAIGALGGNFETPTTFHGNAFGEINKLTGGNTFVDNGVLNTLMNNECLDVPVPVISDDNALLGTPLRRDANLEVRTLFEPNLSLGQLIEIKSSIAPMYNGQYKLLGYTHNCVFSETEAGTRTTSLNLWIGVFTPKTNIAITDNQTQSGFNKVKNEDIQAVNGGDITNVRTVYNYIRANKGKIPNTWITKHISWANMLGNDNTDNERMKELTLAICANCYTTAQRFETMYNKHFKGYTPKINSGWRSNNNNRKCGGATKSRHLYGLALDFRFEGLTINKAYPIVKNNWGGFTLNEGSWIHAQIEPTQGYVNDV